MNPSAHFLTRIPQAQARQAAQMLIADQMGYTPPLSTPAFEDLRSLPQDTQRLSTLVEALSPESVNRSSPTPWYARSGLADLLNPAINVVSREYPAPEHRAFCRTLQARNFLPNRFLMGLDGFHVERVIEHGELVDIREADLDIEVEETQLSRWGAILSLTVESIANDDAGLFARSAEAMLAACYRREASDVFSTLESSPNLADGRSWFDSTNHLTVSAIDAAALASGLELLASQKFTDGEYLDAKPSVLVIPANVSITAGSVLQELQGLPIIKTARVESAYIFADPARTPAVALVGLDPVMAPTIEINPRRSARFCRQLSVEHKFSVLPLSRRGIVKISVGSL